MIEMNDHRRTLVGSCFCCIRRILLLTTLTGFCCCWRPRSSSSGSFLLLLTTTTTTTRKMRAAVIAVPLRYRSSIFRIRGGSFRASPTTFRRSTFSTTTTSCLEASGDHHYTCQQQKPRRHRHRRRISFLTDVEGDRDYLDRYVELSRILTFRPCEKKDRDEEGSLYFPYSHCMDFTCETGCLVYGGDVCDQGGSDLYVTRQLLHLKERYPDRVFIVMGNRDMNKMRMQTELGDIGSDTSPTHPGVYWLRKTGRVGDPDMGKLSNDPIERLQWILGQTMGSPRAFEHRRWELQQERLEQGLNDTVMDEDVLESYRRSCHPTIGEMGRYLSNACLALRLGDALFVHGALPLANADLLEENENSQWDDLTFAMPWLVDEGKTARDVGVKSIDDWLNVLNEFARDNVQLWKDQTGSDDLWCKGGGYGHLRQPYSKLIQYGMGWKAGGARNPTVVYSSWSDNGMPKKFLQNSNSTTDDSRFVSFTREFFEKSGIRLICCGHQPQGDTPNTIKVDLPGDSTNSAYIMSCDTSYSGDTRWFDPSRSNPGRGESRSGRGMLAVSEVVVEQCNETGKLLDVYFHGRMNDGTYYETDKLEFDRNDCSNLAAGVGGENSLVVGRASPSEIVAPDANFSWWTRARLKDPSGSFLLAAGEGFNIWNHIIKP